MPTVLRRPDAPAPARPAPGPGLAVRPTFPQSGTGAGIDAHALAAAAGVAGPARRLSAALAGLLLAALATGLTAPPAWAADEPDAATLYELHCATCHGPDGRPVLPGAPDFRRPDTLARPNGVLMRAIREGKGAMPAYYGVLSDAQMRQIVNHLRRFH